MAEKFNKGDIELVPRIDTSKVESDASILSDKLLRSTKDVEDALQQKMKKLGGDYDNVMNDIVSSYEQALQEAENKIAKSSTRIQQQTEKKFRTQLAQRMGVAPKGKNGVYTAKQLSELQLSSQDKSDLISAKTSALSSSSTMAKRQKELDSIKSNIEALKDLKKITMTFNADALEKIPKILSDIGMSGKKLKDTVAELKDLGEAVKIYEKVAQNEIGRIEGTKSKSPKTGGLDQSQKPTNSSTRIKGLMEALDKSTAETINTKVKQMTRAIEASTKRSVSQAKIDEITEIIYEETIRNLKAQGSKVIPTGKKKSVVEYDEGTPVEKGKGVLTSRSFDSFVINGQFIPSSRYVRNENGSDSREFFRSIGILDSRLANPNKIGGLGNLYNASITQLQQAYDTLTSILDSQNLNQSVRKEIEDFRNVIVSAVSDSFANTNEQELKERLSRSIYGANEYNQNVYEQMYEDATFNKQGAFYEALRKRIPNLSLNTEFDGFDPDDIAYEYKKPDNGRDNATTVEVLMEETVKNAVTVAERVKALKELTDYFKNNGLDSIMQGLSSDLQNTSDTDVRANAIKVAQELIMQALDDMGYKVDYSRNSVKTVTMSDFTSTNDEGDDYNYIEQNVRDIDTPDVILEEKEDLENLKSQYYGLLEQYKSYIQNVITKSLPEDKKGKLLGEIDDLIRAFPEDYDEAEGNQLLKAITALSEIETKSSSIPQNLEDLKKVIDEITFNRKKEQEEAEDISKQALSLEEGRKKVKAGESFKEDELYDKTDDLYGYGWVKRVKEALSKSEGELDDSAKQLINNFVNAVYENTAKIDSQETRGFAQQLQSAFRSSEDSVSLYNILSKMLEEANTVDTSIKRYVEELNKQAGGEYFSFDTELENWKQANPDRVKTYERSKQAREAFDKAGGLVDIRKSMEAVFALDDFYIQQLKQRFDALNYEVKDTITYAMQDEQGNYLTDEKGEIKKKTEEITQNVQETFLKGILGRLDASGTFENPNRVTGANYYKAMQQKGEIIPEGVTLSPQQKTSLYYQAGYTGAVYGGRTIGENITNAEKRLVAKQEELAKKKETLTQTQIEMLEAQIAVIEGDLQTLREANARRMSDSELAQTTLELIQTPDSSQMITVSQGKDSKKEKEESVSKAYERLKRLREAQETKKLLPGYSYRLNNGTTGQILEDLGNDQYKVSMIEDSIIPGMKTKKETTVMGKKFIENLYDYIAPAVQNVSDNVGEQIQEESKKKKTIKVENQTQSQTSIGNVGTTNVSSGISYIDSELTNVNTADVALVSKGTANVNLSGNVKLNGDVSIEEKENAGDSSFGLGKVTSIKGFKPDFIDDNEQHKYVDPETGKSFYSVTQLRDFLLRGQNPTFGVDLDRIKEKAKSNFEAGLGAISVNDFEGMQPNDFKFMVEDVIGQGIRGDTFHSLIDKFIKSGLGTEDWTMEKLAEKDNEAFKEYQEEYQRAVQELAKYGLGEEFLGISERLESYVDAMKKSKMSPTAFSEQRLALKMSGTRGDITVGVTPDQAFSMGTTAAFVDNKTGAVHGQEAFQLTGQVLATLANLDTELTDKEGNVIGKVRDFFKGVDFTKPMKGYIADVEDGVTTLREYVLMSQDEFYNLAMDAKEIAEGKKAPLSKEERNRRMNRQLKTGTTIGYSDAKYSESINEELMFIDANQGKVIKDYLSYLKQINDVQLKIVKAQNDMETADENSKQNIQELLDSYNKQLETLKTNQPQLESFVGSEGLQYRLGQNLLDSEHADYLKKKLDEVNNAFESKSIESINKIKANLEKLTSKDTPINTGLFGEDFDIIVQKIKDGYTEIDRTQESLTAKVKAYEASLRSEVSALKDIATHSTKIQSINEQIDKLQADNSTENSELLNDLNKRLKKEQELLKVAEQRRDVAIQERQGTGLDEDIASGKVDAQTKQRIANAYSQQRQNLVNAVNQGTAKAEADQSVQNYVQANKLIKEYINNLKLQYKTQQEIQKISIKMENQSGNELAASEAYKAALESRIDSLQEQLPYYDQQSKKLGNIKLEEEQIVSLEKQKNNLTKQQQIAQEKINATVKDQRSLLQEIVGGFKQAFRNMTDASIAYEIIGLIRQGITELLQTIREMDSALVDLQIASGGTREEMHDMMMDLNSLATEVGKTTTEVAQGANDWLRAGYEGQEAADLTRASMQLSTLGMIDSADATSYLISVLKGWKLEAEEVSSVVDKLVAVDMAAALNF